MKATLYKELSNKQTPIELQAGLTMQEALPDFDLDNAIIVINGKIEDSDYLLQEKDKVTIRLTPNGTTALIVTAIVIAVVAVAAGIAGGIYAYKARKDAEKAKEELERMKKLSNKPEIDNRPFLRGASNTIATGNNQPYVIGRHFFTPYLLCSPFYEITGKDGIDQYIYTVLECGFNKQVIKKIAIDDVAIKTFKDTTPQEGAYSIDEGIFTEDGRIEIAQDGNQLTDIPSLNYKVNSKTCNDDIPRDSDVKDGKKSYLTYTLNPYAMDVDIAISFPYGLYAMNNDGDKIETQVTITPQYSLDGGSSWNNFYFNNNGVRTNFFKRCISTKELRYVAHKDFTISDYEALKTNNQTAIYIRIRSNGNSGDSSIKNDCYCLFYQSTCYDPDKSKTELVPCKIIEDRERAFCTILALKLKASKINEDKLKKINIITQGIARTWDGKKWSKEKTETRNPAAWALEIETSDSHPASRYSDDELDLESFGEYYEYCEEKGYKFDWIITQNTKKDATLNHIMEATGACIYTDIYGRRAIAIDKPQENALAVYNPQNIINIQNKKTFGRRTDGLRIKYVNSKDDLYQEDTYLLMREVNGKPLEITPDSIIKDINITGITTFDHIVKYARRIMAIEALRPKTTIIEVGNEGVFYTPYSKILIQDDSLKIGIGKGYTITSTKWRSGILKKIYTREPLTFDPMKTYGIIVNCFTETGVQPLPIKIEGGGTTNELTVLTHIRASAYVKPEENNIFSFGELDIDGEFSKITTPYIISQIKRSDNGFNLELVNYHEAIYETGKIPDYKSNITRNVINTTKPIPPNTITREDLDNALTKVDPSGSKAAQEAANVITHGVHFSNIHRIRDMEMSLDEVIARMDADNNRTSASIQMSEDEILLKVEDMQKELVGLIDVQAGSVQAIVEGGGASGRMSVSLELPAMIDAPTRAKFVKASSEEETARVYAKLDGTDYYSIRGDVSKTAIKLLWDKAVKASLLASQIDLTATQINMAAENVVITGEKNKGQTIIEGGFLKTALIDVERLIAKKLHIDTDKNTHQDFEAWFDGTNGLKIKNKGEEIFSIKPNGTAIFSGEIKCAGFQVLNEKYTENPKKLFEWKKGATGHDCIKIIHGANCLELLPKDFITVKTIFYGEGKYGNHVIRVVITEYARFALGKHKCRALLLSNSGEQVGIVSSTVVQENQYAKHITEEQEERLRAFRWQPSPYDFEFYEYRVSQKIRIPNIQFGKPSESNILYRDENGFIKIS
ncbi:MAG: hypothetical protein ACTTJ6_05750 [Treponema sp.]